MTEKNGEATQTRTARKRFAVKKEDAQQAKESKTHEEETRNDCKEEIRCGEAIQKKQERHPEETAIKDTKRRQGRNSP